MNNSEISAGNAAEKSGAAEATTSSQTIANALVGCCAVSKLGSLRLR